MNETDQNTANIRKSQGKQHSSVFRKVGYIVSILFMILFIYILRHLREWGITFLTADFDKCLYYIELSIKISIAAQVMFLFYDNRWFRHVIQGLTNIAGAVALIMVYVIFPFDFNDASWTKWIKIGILILFVLSAISIIVELIKGIRYLLKEPEKI